ncbi:MAG: hypothetical protein LBN12_08790 [Clostridiales Family XIII bacterium]|jgi:hypothetical protein|nr:hypothetical protein [Clostridiales Family XIII bacterium]
MLIEVDWNACGALPHEREILLSGRVPFLLPATLAAIDNGSGERKERLVYTAEGSVAITAFDPDRNTTLGDLFLILENYIRNLRTARDLLLDEQLLSSDPGKGVFVRGREVRSVWGAGAREEAGEKICRVAACLKTKERVMGAGAAMEQVCSRLADGSRGLGECLKAVEIAHREWNYIV